jgi:hypothetical protein
VLKAVFSVGSAPRLYNEDPRLAERRIEREWIVEGWQFSYEKKKELVARVRL